MGGAPACRAQRLWTVERAARAAVRDPRSLALPPPIFGNRALQIHGALGVSTDMPLETMYRNARSARIYDGPDEVHGVTLARQMLRGYAVVDGQPSEHIPTRRRGAAEQFDWQ